MASRANLDPRSLDNYRAMFRHLEPLADVPLEHLCGDRARLVARGGDPEPFNIEENETTFTIDWKGRYRIEGAEFVYMDRETGRLVTIHGYPTHKLIQTR